jgi:hypothetical protein
MKVYDYRPALPGVEVLEFPALQTKLSNRVKAQVIDKGKVVYETPWTSNLILDAGMNGIATKYFCDLFKYCAIGTGNTPTQDDSGVITAARAGTTVTASAPFFAAGDVGKLLRWSTGEKSMITVFTDTTHVTVADSGTVAAAIFSLYRVAQVGLATETKRTNNYVTGASNCFSTRAGSILTNQRTYDHTVEGGGSVNYAEVGFSDNASAGNNLNTRALFGGGAVTVLNGQLLRVVYQFIVTLSPTSNRQKTPTITGWPALVQAVTFDSTTDKVTLASHGLLADYAVVFQGTTPPGGITFGVTYYVKAPGTNDFQLAATPGGALIDITTNGTAVTMTTNVRGSEVSESISLTSIASDGTTTGWEGHGSVGGLHVENEPSGGGMYFWVATDSTALRSFPSTPTNPSGVPTNGSKTVTLDTYTNGTFNRTKSATIAAADAISAAIRSIGCGMNSDFGNLAAGGVRFLFDTKQNKDSVHTLKMVFKHVWDRDFS